ncbi:unnamed protein product [Knipowitschia caucasica]|uniref:C2H2-type domain-containing protein n=1 Tax=Knipowitschia caucasica TaxID=637954 RepID=A0AAV2M2W3_KNICA
MVSLSSRTLTLENDLFRDSSLFSVELGDGAGSEGGSEGGSSCDSPEVAEQGAMHGSSSAPDEDEEDEEEATQLPLIIGAAGEDENSNQDSNLPDFPFHLPSPFSPTLEDIEEFLKEKMDVVPDGLLTPKEEASPLPCTAPTVTPSPPPVTPKKEHSSPRCSQPVVTPRPSVSPRLLLGPPLVLQIQPVPLAPPLTPTASYPGTPIWLTHLVMGLQGATGQKMTLLAPQVPSPTATATLVSLGNGDATLVSLSNGDAKTADQKYVKIAPLPITMRTVEITGVGGVGGQASSMQKAVPPRLSRAPTTERVHKCSHPGCGKMYTKSSHLKAHFRRHTGEKPYTCSWPDCGWRFSRSDELSRHRRSHSGIKPYECSLCEKKFARSDHLSKHTKVHRSSRPSRSFRNTM